MTGIPSILEVGHIAAIVNQNITAVSHLLMFFMARLAIVPYSTGL